MKQLPVHAMSDDCCISASAEKSPSSISHLISNFRKRLCDNDLGVMGVMLCPLFDLITIDVKILMRIWWKCDSTSNIGNAVLYECICWGVVELLISRLTMPFVFHIPQLKVNLLSVHQLCKDNNCYSVFDVFGFLILDKVTHQCQSLVEELSASHSTDLQQRAYELQAIISLDSPAVESIMLSDASFEDIEIDKSLSFLNGYVQQALEKGAQPYIPENERSGMLNISNFSNQDQHEALTRGLRFEAYEHPKPAVPSGIPPAAVASSTELVPVPEPSYAREIRQQPASLPPMSDAGLSELKLRLDCVQRKWALSISNSSSCSSQKSANGVTQIDSMSTSNPKARDSYESRRPQVSKANIHASEKTQVPKAAIVHTEVNHEPAPDLLDLGDSTSSTASTVDPFKQLESFLIKLKH
ncbi:hypothetical protein PRUPE_2G068200 [Prunus persica]|uniref:Uncharacterized protein n=1 Tax=Prunus persica TaxID=3760 RepID=A0A251QDJ2_PRUPE|nr:hypothetical protein PRUPE_2G068200 [Prunus persica]